jgi:WD40 repeat protein
VLITAPEVASLVSTSEAFDDSNPKLILCVGCESGCILLYDPRTARQDTKPIRRLDVYSHIARSIKSPKLSSVFMTEGEFPVSSTPTALSPGSSSVFLGTGNLRRENGIAVTHMCRWPNVGVFIALARGSIQVYDQHRWTLQRTLDFHTDTLVGMCIDVIHKVIITASRDRRLLLWDPFIDKPISEVCVHSAPYVSMLFLHSQQLLVTVGADKVVDIWHVQTMSKVMRFIDDFRHKGINRLSAAVFDPIHSMIFTAGNTIRRFTVNAVEQAIRKHKAKSGAMNTLDNIGMLEIAESAGLGQPIISVLFTSMLGQLVIVSDVECRVVEAQSGCTITSFSLKAHGRCSCACFDICGRRLMTGSETGVVCLWDFSLGRLLKVVNRMPSSFHSDKVPLLKERVEVSCICCIAQANLTVRPVVVGDWNHNVVMCSDSAEVVVDTQPALLQGHRHDVLCVVSCGNFLVSGDANGLAMVWFILNGHRRHVIQVTSTEISGGHSSINCGVWIGSARLCYLGTSEGEIVGVNPVLGTIQSRTPLADSPSVSCIAQGSIWSTESGRQFQMVAGTIDGNLSFFKVPVIDKHAISLNSIRRTNSVQYRLKDSVHSNADALLNSKGTKLQMLGENYVPVLECYIHVQAHQHTVSAVVIAEISGITVSGSTDGGVRLWSWTGKPLSVFGTSIPWPYWEISNQSNQELISQEMERLEREKEEEKAYDALVKLKQIEDSKSSAARLHRQWCVNVAKTSSGAGLLPLSESVDVLKFFDEPDNTLKSSTIPIEFDSKSKSGSLLVPSSLFYRPIDGIDHICASLLKQKSHAVQDVVRSVDEESRLNRIFMQLETAMTQSEDPRDAGHIKLPVALFVAQTLFAEELRILEEKLKILKYGINSEECAGIEKGRLSDPPHYPFCEMNIDDLVPPAMGHKALKGRLELLVELHEVLNKNCFLIYDCFRAYCALGAVDIERFFTLSRTDFSRFCKDTRCPRHVLTKTDSIFRSVEPHKEAKYKIKGPNRELILSEFVELLVSPIIIETFCLLL